MSLQSVRSSADEPPTRWDLIESTQKALRLQELKLPPPRFDRPDEVCTFIEGVCRVVNVEVQAHELKPKKTRYYTPLAFEQTLEDGNTIIVRLNEYAITTQVQDFSIIQAGDLLTTAFKTTLLGEKIGIILSTHSQEPPPEGTVRYILSFKGTPIPKQPGPRYRTVVLPSRERLFELLDGTIEALGEAAGSLADSLHHTSHRILDFLGSSNS